MGRAGQPQKWHCCPVFGCGKRCANRGALASHKAKHALRVLSAGQDPEEAEVEWEPLAMPVDEEEPVDEPPAVAPRRKRDLLAQLAPYNHAGASEADLLPAKRRRA